MEVLDKRIVTRLQEDDLKSYQLELLHHLPDCSEKAEFVDGALLLSQIPSRHTAGALREAAEGNSREEAQEHAG